MAVVGQALTRQRRHAVGGGEVLVYMQMVERVLEAPPRPARLYQVPPSLCGLALNAAQRQVRLRGTNAAALQRMRENPVFDLGPARRDFGYVSPIAEELGIGE
ncbi:hypothetical protein CVO74_11345 [Xanthomonas prunicola]|uniref:Uncharacterized protein n=1 Tax=Xanthomonas prunicola TaxID=2053930 RepID=A0A2N3RM55_9XANT|nr:hypothetical protein XpruCFBP8353_09290 [Xanthomonas prunicola]PKV17837.1 hypothetical protein XpruCFBP8354_09290 [Xanthomonas prunicola]PKV21730.1 hypothetical protein CVO74_11345 [Xanthomonas prunicola]